MANLIFPILICLYCLFHYASKVNSCPNSKIGLNFNYPNFSTLYTPGFQAPKIDGIHFVGDAVVSSSAVHLTNSNSNKYRNSNKSMGGIVYNKPLQLSAIASFNTHFVFSMDSNNLPAGYGIAFIISSQETAYDISNLTNGGNDTNEFIAVVFSSMQQAVSIVALDADYVKESRVSGINDGIPWYVWIGYEGIELRVYLSRDAPTLESPQNCVLAETVNLSDIFSGNVSTGLFSCVLNSIETNNIFSWSFNSTSNPRNTSVGSNSTWNPENTSVGSNSTGNGMSSKEKGQKRLCSDKKILMAVGCGVVACISGILWGHFFFVRRKRDKSIIRGGRKKWACIDVDKLLHHVPRRFKLDDLVAGTKNFSEVLKIGQGGFGGVYRCNLVQTNEIVAVKRISEGSRQGVKEFISEVSTVSRLRHRNLVQLLGWCHERDQLLLVYEYMPNGSLDTHIFTREEGEEDEPKLLEWSTRYKIASEIASALLYLHEGWDECVVHRDVKASNILLDTDFTAKIGDFGLARMLRHERLAQTTGAAGTLGYLAPECVVWGKTSPQSDVYSFGAVALEIASGKQAIDLSLVEFDMRLVAWTWEMYGRGRLLEVADATLNGVFKKEEMERLMVVGLWCSHPDAACRPNMRQVVRLLNFEVAPLILPAALPVASYGQPSITTGPSVPLQSSASLSPR